MSKSCWTCGHYAFACFVSGQYEKVEDCNNVCSKWVPEGTKGTVTDFYEESDGTSWGDNEYLKDDESNL